MNVRAVLFAAITLAAARSFAQPPAPPPTISVIDSAGNTYTISGDGPVTAGAAQTQPGGGQCFFDPTHSVPCSDVHIFKTDSSGNVSLAASSLIAVSNTDARWRIQGGVKLAF